MKYIRKECATCEYFQNGSSERMCNNWFKPCIYDENKEIKEKRVRNDSICRRL